MAGLPGVYLLYMAAWPCSVLFISPRWSFPLPCSQQRRRIKRKNKAYIVLRRLGDWNGSFNCWWPSSLIEIACEEISLYWQIDAARTGRIVGWHWQLHILVVAPSMASPQGQRPALGATFYPGGVDDFYMPEVISPSPQRCVPDLALIFTGRLPVCQTLIGYKASRQKFPIRSRTILQI